MSKLERVGFYKNLREEKRESGGEGDRELRNENISERKERESERVKTQKNSRHEREKKIRISQRTFKNNENKTTELMQKL